MDVLRQTMDGGNSVKPTGVRRRIRGAYVWSDWHWWICHFGHFHRRMLCHGQPQPAVPYAGSC